MEKIGEWIPEIFTIVNAGLLVLKVEDSGELGDAELGGKVRVVRLDELDAHRVGVVVYLLQLLDGFVASGTVRSVCNTLICKKMLKIFNSFLCSSLIHKFGTTFEKRKIWNFSCKAYLRKCNTVKFFLDSLKS